MMDKRYFTIIAVLFFIFMAWTVLAREIKIKEEIITTQEKIYLSDFVVTDDNNLLEMAKKVQMGYSPYPGKENTVKGDYIKIKIKQMKYLKQEEIEKIDFSKNVIVKREKKSEIVSTSTEAALKTGEKYDLVFLNEIYVAEEKIMLADFIETDNVELKEKARKIPIGFSPKPGETKRIKNEMVKLKLKQLGIQNIDEYDIPDEFTITTQSQKITKKEIAEFINEEISAAYGNEQYKVKIDENSIEDVSIPQGIYNLLLVQNPGVSKKLGRFKCEYVIEVNGEAYKKGTINGETGILKNVYTATVDIARSVEFSEEMIEEKEIIFFSQEQIKSDIEKESLKGKILKRGVKKGEIIEESMFAKKKLFKKNDNVTTIVVLDGAIVTSTLKAMEDGYEGENVPLVNPVSKKIVNGVVQSDGTVQIIIQ